MGFKVFLVILFCANAFSDTLGSPQQYGNYGHPAPTPVRNQQWQENELYRPPTNNNRECRSQEVSQGRFKVICGGPGPTVSQQHILWLQQGAAGTQVIDIEVPNYAIRELIKAGFKPTTVGGSTINVLLKRPQTHVDAQVDVPRNVVGVPSVNIQYETPQSKIIHFPNDQQYSTLQGPIVPPLAPQHQQHAQTNIRYG